MNDKRFQKKLEKMKQKGERQKAKYELEEQYAEYYPHKTGKRVSNIMLVVIVTMILAYTAANFWLAAVSGTSMDSTLTTCFYAFWSAEILVLGGIKISKVRKEPYEYEEDDTDL